MASQDAGPPAPDAPPPATPSTAEERLLALTAEHERLRRALAAESAARLVAEQTLVARESEVHALHETSLALMHHLASHHVLRTILERAAALVGTGHGFLYLVNQAESTLEMAVALGGHDRRSYPRLRPGEGLSGVVWQRGRAIWVEDYNAWAERLPQGAPAGCRTMVAVPLLSEVRVVGVIGLSFEAPPRPRDEGTIALLQRFAQLAALALDNAELYATARRQAQELALLGQVRTAIARELDCPALFRTVVEAIAGVFGYTQVSLYLLDGDTLVLQHQVGYELIVERIPTSRGVTGRVARSRQPVLLEDVRDDPAFIGVIDGVTSEVCVPLLDHERVIGVLNVESIRGVRLTNADLQLMVALAEHVSIAITRAELYDAVRRRAQTLEALRATMTEISANLHLDALLKAIVERQVMLLSGTSGELGLYDPQRGDLEIVVSYNLPRDMTGTRQAIGDGIMGRAALTRAPVVVANYQSWEGRAASYADLPPAAVLVVPLLAGDQLIGALGVGDSNIGRVFSPDDVHLLSLFAQQATVAIQNARLFAEAQQLAITDPLTGLYNRRHFFHLARRAFGRARGGARAVAALMIDVDNFKRFNDTYGHAAGDQVLQLVGSQCKAMLRAADIVGRYGGEEIVALLPDVDRERAVLAAERLRASLEQSVVSAEGQLLHVTASIGVAALEPDDPADLETLLSRADRALYLAKFAGKNRVAAWREGGLDASPDWPPHSCVSLRPSDAR